MNPPHPSRMVAIVGGSGAGKSWLAAQLHRLLGEKATRLSLDDFYQDRSHLPPSRRAAANFDRPDAIDWALFERVLLDCTAGRATDAPQYDFRTHCRLPGAEPLRPRAVMLVDGRWLLTRPGVRRLFQLKIFIECPMALRLRHRVARDVAERALPPAMARRHFRTVVEPLHRRHVAPQIRWADVVLQHPFSPAQVQQLHEGIWNFLQHRSLLPAWMRETFRAELSALLNAKDFPS